MGATAAPPLDARARLDPRVPRPPANGSHPVHPAARRDPRAAERASGGEPGLQAWAPGFAGGPPPPAAAVAHMVHDAAGRSGGAAADDDVFGALSDMTPEQKEAFIVDLVQSAPADLRETLDPEMRQLYT